MEGNTDARQVGGNVAFCLLARMHATMIERAREKTGGGEEGGGRESERVSE